MFLRRGATTGQARANENERVDPGRKWEKEMISERAKGREGLEWGKEKERPQERQKE